MIDHSYRQLFVRNARGQRILQERVLMVGAGGIGCELLKNLVLTGFAEIHIVDLDTIDLSNLNRQFLFGHEHIKQPKAKVAKDSAEKFNHKGVKIEYYHANIKDEKFDADFFSTFAVIFNALDNVDARRHVNRMVIAADVPMVDCGTTGYQGHTSIIKRGVYPCYDCEPKEVPKSFPVCTIRSTPSQPIHCIVWAKSYLFTELFGISEDEVPELNTSEDSENAAEIKKLKEEAEALRSIRANMRDPDYPLAQNVFTKIFKNDVERLASMEEMWQSRKRPTALDYDDICSGMAKLQVQPQKVMAVEQRAWSLQEAFSVWSETLTRCANKLTHADSDSTTLSFDKDDEDMMNFVAATASLRSYVFGIEQKSKFDMKQMAGNIIPAIATTNAMFAALATLESYKIIQASRKLLDWPTAGPVFSQFNTERAIEKERIASKPNPQCAVCGVAWQRLGIDAERATVQHLVDLLVDKFDYDAEEMTVETKAGLIIWDPDLQENASRLLSSFDVAQGGVVTIRDERDEDTKVNLLLAVSYRSLGEDSPMQITDEIKPLPTKPLPPPMVEELPLDELVANPNATDPVVERNGTSSDPSTLKRKRAGSLEGGTNGDSVKRRAVGDAADTIVVDDAGVIELD